MSLVGSRFSAPCMLVYCTYCWHSDALRWIEKSTCRFGYLANTGSCQQNQPTSSYPLIVPLEIVPLRITCILSNWRNTHHKHHPLCRTIQVGNVYSHPLEKRTILGLVDLIDKGRTVEGTSELERHEAVFGKA